MSERILTEVFLKDGRLLERRFIGFDQTEIRVLEDDKAIEELIEINNQKVDIIRDLNEMLDFSEEAIEKSKGVITKQTQL